MQRKLTSYRKLVQDFQQSTVTNGYNFKIQKFVYGKIILLSKALSTFNI